MLTLQGILQSVSLPTSLFFWLPAEDIGEHMILYTVLVRQDAKQDKKLKICHFKIVNMKARWEKPIRKATKKAFWKEKRFLVHERRSSPLMVYS